MKKTFAAKMLCLVMVLTFVVSMAACGSGGGIAGTYKLDTVVSEGITIKAAEYAKQMSELLGQKVDFDMTLTLKDDGSLKMSVNALGASEENEGTWEQDGNTLKLTIDGDTQEAAYSDGKISMSFEGVEVNFSKK